MIPWFAAAALAVAADSARPDSLADAAKRHAETAAPTQSGTENDAPKITHSDEGTTLSLSNAEITLSIALTSTALGTLLPILKDAGLIGRPVGDHVLRHGAVGELGPILGIAVLLGTQGPLRSLVVLAAFALIALLVTVWSLRLQRRDARVLQLIRRGAATTGQTMVRVTMLLLVSLLAVATAFHLDIVLAAFAAGFVLRAAIPEGDEHLEARLEGIAFGLLVFAALCLFALVGLSLVKRRWRTTWGAAVAARI